MKAPPNPFSLGLSAQVSNPYMKPILPLVEPALERMFALSALAKVYNDTIAKGATPEDFSERGLEALGISYRVSDEGLERIPRSGQAVIVANHPFGGIEGVIMISLLKRVRPDFRLMANFILQRIKELEQHFIFVDPFGTSSAAKKNFQPLRDSLQWLKGGGLLSTFPSGTVSHLQMRSRHVVDPVWNINIARMIRKTQAPVVPMFFEGHNGWLFQSLGLVHPLLRTAMLPREMWRKRDQTIGVRIGNVIPWERLAEFDSDEEVLAYLRLRTYILGSTPDATKKRRSRARQTTGTVRNLEPIAPAVDPNLLHREISSLPQNNLLVESKDYQVWFAAAHQIPFTLREIGRLREFTFRKVAEGTGKSLDLDRFDNYYTHLFMWNHVKREVIGAYRLVSVEDALENYGTAGLYTSTLFAYRPALLEQIVPALELGRSFVRTEYQRNYNSLHLLWRGIGQYVVKNPRFKVLFGTVSISSEYDSVSRQLITSFLKGNNYLPEFARLIRARNPHRPLPLRGVDEKTQSVVVKDLGHVSELLAEIEAKHHSIPVLLKQYLKLGGKLLGFNIDKNFGDVLDGLIYVDLTETDFRILERYLGKDSVESFLAYHGRVAPEPVKTVA